MKSKVVVVLVAAIVMVGVFYLGAKLYDSRREAKLAKIEQANPDNEFVRSYSQRLGSPNAKVMLVEFLDPGCESCAALSPYVKSLVQANEGRVQLVIRYIPLHQGADVAVRILEAARKQGKYWETMEMMFGTQQVWASHHHPAPERLFEYLPRLGLDMERLQQDMQGPEVSQILAQDMTDAQTLGVRRTPTFFVNGKPLLRFGLQELQQLVASEVAANYE